MHAFTNEIVWACGLAPIGLEAIVAIQNLGSKSSMELRI